MARNLGIQQSAEIVRQFIGGHGTIEKAATLSSTGAAASYPAGRVLAKVAGKYLPFNAAEDDGSQIPAAILIEDVDVPADGDAKSSVYVHGEFLSSGLTWGAANAAQIAAAVDTLAGVGIYVK